MRVFALSDIHVDYDVNAQWVEQLSTVDYRDDVLILAGDISDRISMLSWCLHKFARCFAQVLFVPGNHDLWVFRDAPGKNSFDKFREIRVVAEDAGVSMQPFRHDSLYIVPLLGWYDYTFGALTESLRAAWMDFIACRWPDGVEAQEISLHFGALNPTRVPQGIERVITFSHFVPRIDLLPTGLAAEHRMLLPVLGSTHLDTQLRNLGSRMHVYGHSHINRHRVIDGVVYINNAFGYPHEERIASKALTAILTD